MTTLLRVTATPQTFPANTFASTALAINTGIWRFTFTPTLASTAFTGGNFHGLFAQNNGGIWLDDANLELYTTPGDALVFSQPLTWLAGQAITVIVDARAATRGVTITGATLGNGTFAFSQVGPYIDLSQTLESGQFGTAQFTFLGTISSIDDTAPEVPWVPWYGDRPRRRATVAALAMSFLAAPVSTPSLAFPDCSWLPVMPARQARRAPLRTGGVVVPELFATNAAAPPLSWAPTFPDRPLAKRAAVIAAGVAGPEATITNPDATPLSWAPLYADRVLRARGAPLVGGYVAPEATLPTVASPGIGWLPTFPDATRPGRRAYFESSFAPPFGGGVRLTTGAAAVRQNILSGLAFTGGSLTTFGTNLTFTADASTDTLTMAAHGMVLCAGPFFLSTTGTLPGNTDSVTPYFVAAPTSTTTKLALSPALAKAGTVVDITSAGTGTHTFLRAVDTAPLYSTFVAAFARGNQASSPNQATDARGNAYAYISGTPRPYDAFTGSSASVAVKLGAAGGSLHTWSASIGNVGGNEDEVMIAGLEIFGAPILQSSSIVERADGSAATITSGTVTTTAKALLVAIVFGNGNVNQEHVFTFLDGFSKVARACAEGDVNPNGYIQVEIATRLVDIKGTYSFRAQGTASEGGQMALLAFQSVAVDLQPFDWLSQGPELARRTRPRPEGGSVDPIVVASAPVVTPLSWAPVYSSPQRARRSAQQVPTTAELVIVDATTWFPIFSGPTRVRSQRFGGEVAPPSDTNAGPLTWAGQCPDRVSRSPRWPSSGEVAPLVLPALIDWLPIDARPQVPRRHPAAAGVTDPVLVPPPLVTAWLPDVAFWRASIRRPDHAAGVEPLLPSAVAPPPDMSWMPVVPARIDRARSVVRVGGVSAPEAAIPNAAAPAMSWAPIHPDVVARRVARPVDVVTYVFVQPVPSGSSPVTVHARRVSPVVVGRLGRR